MTSERKVGVVFQLNGRRMIEGQTFGRVWRLWLKPWRWPYAFHQWGVRCAGIGPIGFQVFDGPATLTIHEEGPE